MAREGNLVCRVRLKNDTYYLSIKARIDNMSSYDYEYTIPAEDGLTMLEKLCDKPPVVKTRHLIKRGDLMWEIDEFHGENAGLVAGRSDPRLIECREVLSERRLEFLMKINI